MGAAPSCFLGGRQEILAQRLKTHISPSDSPPAPSLRHIRQPGPTSVPPPVPVFHQSWIIASNQFKRDMIYFTSEESFTWKVKVSTYFSLAHQWIEPV